MNERINQLESLLEKLTDEIVTLASEASKGNLEIQADAGKYRGGWAVILTELNNLVKSVAAQGFWYESILDSIPMPLSVTDSDMNWKFVNKATESALGKNRKDILGKNCRNWGTEICGTEKCGIACLKRGINQTTFSQGGMDFMVNVASLKDANGKDVGYIELVQDITKMNETVKQLKILMGKIKAVSEQVSDGARQFSESSAKLADGAAQQSFALMELNSGVSSISEKTHVNAEYSHDASHLSEKAKEYATKGDKEMQMMLTSMEEIKTASNDISKIIKTIEDIAFQTNLLALNAAVEAARAGEHGKGFAVVAEEVRSLAQRSQVSAKETNDLITNSINRVQEGTSIAISTAQTLSDMVENFDKISEIIDKIATASSEQAEAVEQISHGIMAISDITQENASVSQETAASSQELASQATVLNDLIREN
ncbi:MAG: methyl-accepting chemotaxis protein [Clostridiales bacterium]|nr:methyl-accepting chemotaxis protein [Clostridiales bacterium]